MLWWAQTHAVKLPLLALPSCKTAGFNHRLVAAFEPGDPLPQLQRVGILETPVLQAFRWRPPETVAKTVDEVSSRFNKPQQPIFVNY
jgi:hypothetical protein